MATSKYIDIICAAAALCALLLTGLFMNGEALGLAAIAGGDGGDGPFTANDRSADWDRANATRIELTGDGGSVKGGGAYLSGGGVHIAYAGKYVISGELTDGSVIIDADSGDKIWILLDGVSIHRDDSAAILVEQAGKVFLTLADGTENVVSSGESYTEEAVSAKIDGAIFSRDDLTINGGGSLSVTAAYRHGVVCNDDLVIVGGDIAITAVQDGIHANDSARFADVNLTINAGDDGITVSNDDDTAYIYIESGHISIPSCYEGIEAIEVTIAGGVIDIRPEDDGINANGRGSNSAIRISGGDITIINENGRDADGLDSNGSIYISGGNTFISVNTSSYALDYGIENGGVCEISGGRVVAAGGSAMAEGFDSSSEQNFLMYTTSSAPAGSAVTLKNEAGNTLISETIPCSFSSVVISTPELQLGETCTISVGDRSEEITIDNSSASGGFGMGGMFGGGMQPGGSFDGMSGVRGGKTNRASGDRLEAVNAEAADRGRPDVPDLPAGNTQPLDIPELPDGDSGRGGPPQLPDGGFAPGEPPQLPDGDFTRGGGRHGGDQFMRGEQDRDWARDGAAAETSALSPEAFIPVGLSALVLLAGILFVVKVKH